MRALNNFLNHIRGATRFRKNTNWFSVLKRDSKLIEGSHSAATNQNGI